MLVGKERICIKSIIYFYILCDIENCIFYVDYNIYIKLFRIFFMYFRIYGFFIIF